MGAIVRWSPRRRLTVAGAAVLAAVLVAVALMLTASAPSLHSASGPTVVSAPAAASTASPMTSAPKSSSVLPPLPRADDPATYAREVADALFDVNPAAVTRAEFLRFWQAELPSVVYSDAAAKGLGLAAQNGDAISNLTQAWIPPQDAWRSEATEQTTNQFTITSVSVPDYWVNAVADGSFRDPGLHLERVMGVLHQSYGTDPAHRQTSTRSVVIDLGLLCGPTQPGGCRLLAPQAPPGLGTS